MKNFYQSSNSFKKTGLALLLVLQLVFLNTPILNALAQEAETATVETGDANSGGTIINDVNTSVVDESPAEEPAPEEEVPVVEETTTPLVCEVEPCEVVPEEQIIAETEPTDTGADTQVNNNNEAGIGNTGSSTADTGINSTNGANNPDSNGGDGGTIDTGSADSSMDVINLVNTTILGSDGTLSIMNIFSALFGNLDLSQSFNGISPSCPEGCRSIFSGDVSVTNNNTATITNDLIVRANTGVNSSNGGLGGGNGGTIVTGDANAAGNIFNLVNTNIVGSNYLLLVFNNFAEWGGNIILPSKYAFNSCCGGLGSVLNATNNNLANIENNASADAISGGNTANGGMGSTTSATDESLGTTSDAKENGVLPANGQNGGSGGNAGLIMTGDASSATNILNQTNTNIFGSDSVYIILRFFGNWGGSVYSLPEGVTWGETDGGIAIYSDPENRVIARDDGNGNTTTILNNNTADIKNNVRVIALTGDNKADGGNGGEGNINGGNGGTIVTGNAHAVANVVNIVNTNVIGRNWVFAIINIFGDWGGNVSFGQPDLWVGETVSNIPSAVTPGHGITYNLTVVNNGDTDATNVLLHDDFDERYLDLRTSNGGNRTDRGIEWNLGTLVPGEARVLSYEVAVKDNLPIGGTSVANTANVSATEPDATSDDNVETTSVMLVRNREANISSNALADFKITKSHNATSSTIKAGESVDYKIVLKNNGGGKGYNARVIDNLYYEDETTPTETREWPLDTVFSGEEITITYTLEVSADARPGTYRNVAKLIAEDDRRIDAYFLASESQVEITQAAPASAPVSVVENVTPTTTADDIVKRVNERVYDFVNGTGNGTFEEVSEEPLEPVSAFDQKEKGKFKSLSALLFYNFGIMWPWLLLALLALLIAYLIKRSQDRIENV